MKTIAVDPAESAIEDCDDAVREGADPAAIVEDTVDADESLINAMGRSWVLRQAGAVDDSDESWEVVGLPWCRRYAAAYRARARELLGHNP